MALVGADPSAIKARSNFVDWALARPIVHLFRRIAALEIEGGKPGIGEARLDLCFNGPAGTSRRIQCTQAFVRPRQRLVWWKS
jgi:hypothetical protein